MATASTATASVGMISAAASAAAAQYSHLVVDYIVPENNVCAFGQFDVFKIPDVFTAFRKNCIKYIIRHRPRPQAIQRRSGVLQQRRLVQRRARLGGVVRPHHVKGVGLPGHRGHFYPPGVKRYSVLHKLTPLHFPGVQVAGIKPRRRHAGQQLVHVQ